MTSKDTLAEMIEKRTKIINANYDNCDYSEDMLSDLQQLQAEQPKQEADIDKIKKEIRGNSKNGYIFTDDAIISIEKHLTQKTTVSNQE